MANRRAGGVTVISTQPTVRVRRSPETVKKTLAQNKEVFSSPPDAAGDLVSPLIACTIVIYIRNRIKFPLGSCSLTVGRNSPIFF